MSPQPDGDLAPYLEPGPFVDADAPQVVYFAREAVAGAHTEPEKAALLFRAVRDGIRYDPYTITADPTDYRASTVVGSEAAYCIPKAVLLAAAARAVGIPARPGFADVRNHLASDKLLARMGTDLFVFHGYVELHVDGRWRKATPAFNASLCSRFGVAPLEFDGVSDALLHPYDGGGRRYMEYVKDHGTFVDLPLELVLAAIRRTYGEQVFGPASIDDEALARSGRQPSSGTGAPDA